MYYKFTPTCSYPAYELEISNLEISAKVVSATTNEELSDCFAYITIEKGTTTPQGDGTNSETKTYYIMVIKNVTHELIYECYSTITYRPSLKSGTYYLGD